MEKEIWKRVIIDNKKTEYLISNYGRIKSFVKYKEGKLLSPSKTKAGYYTISINFKKRSNKKYLIHRLVSMHFLNDYSEDLTVDHIDGQKLNNYYKNLENVTNSENVKRAFKNNLSNMRGENNSMNKFKEKTIHKICKLLEKGISAKDINKILGINNIQLIYDIKAGSSWKYISKDYLIKKKEKGSTTKLDKEIWVYLS